jgi:hypothetical protein
MKLRRIKNFFYKDSHLTVKRKKSTLPDGGLVKSVTVNMLTFSPAQTKTAVLRDDKDSVDMVGTYGLNPWDIFNPFKENSNIAWLLMYNQGLIKDVTAEIIHPVNGTFLITVNNPQVGQPYVVLYDNPVEAAIPMAGKRFNLDENQSATWTSKEGWAVTITRNGDGDCKEFLIIV